MAVREFQAFAQDECVGEAVRRDSPGFGECGLRELSDAVDGDKIALHDADGFAGPGVGGDNWIQGFWFATKRDHEASARPANFAREDEQFLFRIILRCFRKSQLAYECRENDEQPEKNPAACDRNGAVSHATLPRLLPPLLYAPGLSCNALASPKYPRENGTILTAGKYIHQ